MDFKLPYALAYSVIMLVAVFVVGYLVARAPFVRRFYLPTALVSGIILLILSPQSMGRLSPDLQLSSGFYDLWRTAPGILINVVFACLFLASPLMPLKKIWKVAGPQVAFSQMMGWGQFFWAGLLALVVLVPFFGLLSAGVFALVRTDFFTDIVHKFSICYSSFSMEQV